MNTLFVCSHKRDKQMIRVTIEHPSCLNCWVCGDRADRVFTVEIAGTRNVSALKKATKEQNKPAFDHIPADVLEPLRRHALSFVGDEIRDTVS